MVTLQILVLPFLVRVQVGQHNETSASERRFSFSLRPLLSAPSFRERHRSAAVAVRSPGFVLPSRKTGTVPTGIGDTSRSIRSILHHISFVPARSSADSGKKATVRRQRSSAAGGDGTGTAASGDALPQATRTRTATEKGTKQKTASPGPRGERFPAARQRADTPSEILRSGTDTAPPFDPESPTEPHNPNFGLTARLKVRTAFGAARRQCSQGIPERPVRFPPRRPGTPPGIPAATERPAALFPERETNRSRVPSHPPVRREGVFHRKTGRIVSRPLQTRHRASGSHGRTGQKERTERHAPPERSSPLPADRHRNPIFRCVPGHPRNKVAGGVGKSGGKPLFLTLEET